MWVLVWVTDCDSDSDGDGDGEAKAKAAAEEEEEEEAEEAVVFSAQACRVGQQCDGDVVFGYVVRYCR